MARNSAKIPPAVLRRAKKIRVLLMDVDGVLTDGRIYLQSLRDGEAAEMKVFSAQDGAGLKLAHIMGLKTGVITGRDSAATARRAREMEMDFVFQKQPRKLEAFREIVTRAGVKEEEVAFVGDDLPDLPLFQLAGLAVAVANAVPEVKRAAHYVTRRSGGDGAVREVIELIFKAQGRWGEAVPKSLA